MRTVIDHCMNPQIRDHSDENFNFWAGGMRRIANETGAHCKLSGLVSGANERWSADDLKPYAGHVLDVFGCDRIMWDPTGPSAASERTAPAGSKPRTALPADCRHRNGPKSSAATPQGSAGSTYEPFMKSRTVSRRTNVRSATGLETNRAAAA